MTDPELRRAAAGRIRPLWDGWERGVGPLVETLADRYPDDARAVVALYLMPLGPRDVLPPDPAGALRGDPEAILRALDERARGTRHATWAAIRATALTMTGLGFSERMLLWCK